ncbi:type IV toxin-antitoxin system AbiEi family antitoxin domain-containing protein [Nocardioides sp. YIM 152315]|uniref:type IV toxin-antitoxin system AbiEi family antitoxin domain-containing protein n=1 Tax=Nocardioides sp. YIM 152315 TaxID=3031760 RepID=UPI0023DB6CFA|nr:type IV toxin-antitoxin system AbiEi family antitoxin domain-containing protein [Nocardioides sp. YIM 152315]MDF1604961.1 type IV toxin-antitoxin system AbiEi family antitoxin domain-containing protein [Nocardioides sp. YIM 152315]
MKPTFAWHFAHQHSLITRRQALASGIDADALRKLLRTGDWVAVRRGVYTTRVHWESLDVYVGRPRLEVWAAVLVTKSFHSISHDSSAYLQGLPILEATPRLVHVTRVGHLGGRTRHGIKHHQAPVEPEQIMFVDGHPVLDLPRTVADIGREHGMRHGIVAASSALRAGVTRKAMSAAIEPMTHWPYVTAARTAIALADGRCENPGEALVKLMLEQLALGVVHPQFGVQEGGRVAWVDFRVGRHLIEFDGRFKYLRESDGGYADRRPEDVVWEEKRRQDWLCGFKTGMSRVVWDEVQEGTWDKTMARLHREITDTHARFGTSIDDLAPYVIRRARRS